MTVNASPKPQNPTPRSCDYSQLQIQFDWRDWLPYIESSDLTETQKKELIETLWSIIMAFVDLGWDVGNQRKSCGKQLDLTAAMRAAVVKSEENNKEVP